MTDEQTRAMEVWHAAENAQADEMLRRDNGIRADQAAASVIATALAEKDAEIAALRKALVLALPSLEYHAGISSDRDLRNILKRHVLKCRATLAKHGGNNG